MRYFSRTIDDLLRYGTVRYVTIGYGTVRYDWVRYARVRDGTLRYGTLGYARVRYGTLAYGALENSDKNGLPTVIIKDHLQRQN